MTDLRNCAVLQAPPVSSMPQVVERLTEIRDGVRRAAPTCGIGYFTDLYLTITQGILGRIESGGFFADDEYLARLDVVFANRYFDALRAWAEGSRAPSSWVLVFEAPPDGELTGVQLAAAGVNAHINFDLAVATVATGKDMGDVELDSNSRRLDYDRVNDVFAENMHVLLSRLLEEGAEQGPPSLVLVALCELIEKIVETARRGAWNDAGILWDYRCPSEDWTAKEQQMDAVATLIGRSLLWDVPG